MNHGAFARQRLRAMATVEGLHSDGKPVVLFLCVHNAGPTRWSRAADVVVTMGCRDACPYFPGKRVRLDQIGASVGGATW